MGVTLSEEGRGNRRYPCKEFRFRAYTATFGSLHFLAIRVRYISDGASQVIRDNHKPLSLRHCATIVATIGTTMSLCVSLGRTPCARADHTNMERAYRRPHLLITTPQLSNCLIQPC